MSETWVAPAIIATLNCTKNNGLRPFGELAAHAIETAGVEYLRREGSDAAPPWRRWKASLLRNPLRILEHLAATDFTREKHNGVTTVLLSPRAERVRKEYIRKMPELFDLLKKM